MVRRLLGTNPFYGYRLSCWLHETIAFSIYWKEIAYLMLLFP